MIAKTPIKLPIYHYTDKVEDLIKAGLEYDIEECTIHYITFFDISGISPDKDNHSLIFSNGETFMCNKSYNEVMVFLNSIGYISDQCHKLSK